MRVMHDKSRMKTIIQEVKNRLSYHDPSVAGASDGQLEHSRAMYKRLLAVHDLEHYGYRELIAYGVSSVYSTLIRRVRERLLQAGVSRDQAGALCKPNQGPLRADYVPGQTHSASSVSLVAALRFMFEDAQVDLFGEPVWLLSTRPGVQMKAICFIKECLQLTNTNQQIEMIDFILDKMAIMRRGGLECLHAPGEDQDCSRSEMRFHLMSFLDHYHFLLGKELLFHEQILPLLKQTIYVACRPVFQALLKDELPADTKLAWGLTYQLVKAGGCLKMRSWEEWERTLGGDQHDHARIFSMLKLSMERVFDKAKGEDGRSLSAVLEEEPSLKTGRSGLHIMADRLPPENKCISTSRVLKGKDPGEKLSNGSLLLDCLLNDLVRGDSAIWSLFSEVTEWAKLATIEIPPNPLIANKQVQLITDARSLELHFDDTNQTADGIYVGDQLSESKGEGLPALFADSAEHWHFINDKHTLPAPRENTIWLKVPAGVSLDLSSCVIDPGLSLVLVSSDTQTIPADFSVAPGNIVLLGFEYEQCRVPYTHQLLEAMSPEQFQKRFSGRDYNKDDKEIDARHYLFTGELSLLGVDSALFYYRSYSHLLIHASLEFDRREWFILLSDYLDNSSYEHSENHLSYKKIDKKHPTLNRLRTKCNLNLAGRYFPGHPIPISEIRTGPIKPDSIHKENGDFYRSRESRWANLGYVVLKTSCWRDLWSRGLQSSVECRLSLGTIHFPRVETNREPYHYFYFRAVRPIWLVILTLGICLLVYRARYSKRLRLLNRLREALPASRHEELSYIYHCYRWNPLPKVIQNYLHHQLGHLPAINALSNREKGLLLGSSPENQAEYLPLFAHRRELDRFVKRHMKGSREDKHREADAIAMQLKQAIPAWQDVESDADKQQWYRGMEPLLLKLLCLASKKRMYFKAFSDRLMLPENLLLARSLLRLGELISKRRDELVASNPRLERNSSYYFSAKGVLRNRSRRVFLKNFPRLYKLFKADIEREELEARQAASKKPPKRGYPKRLLLTNGGNRQNALAASAARDDQPMP